MAIPWDQDNLCELVQTDPHFTSNIAADIFSGRLQLAKLVEDLGDLLSSLDPAKRASGTLILSLSLKELPPDFLPEKEIELICDFFCNRIKDHHDVLPGVFTGLLAVCHMGNIPKGAPARILSAIFLNINCQSQHQRDRHIIYQILHGLIISHLNDVKEMGPDLVFGLISAIDGERDPRNLLFLFTVLPPLLKSLPLGHLTEEFFEVMACYFPIDFKPAADDPGALTREDLALGLASCLIAIPDFAEFCLPLLLEKLDSSLLVAKLDSLFLLEQSCKVFTTEDLSVHLSPLWMSLSREALTGNHGEVKEAARSAISALLRNFAISPAGRSPQTNPLDQLLDHIISATTSTLNEVQTNLFLPSAQLLQAAAKTCHTACQSIFKRVVSQLCQSFSEKTSSSERLCLLQNITLFLDTCIAMKVSPKDGSESQTIWCQTVLLYLESAQNGDSLIRKEAFHGLSLIVANLTSNDRQHLYDTLSLTVDSDVADNIRDECEHCLYQVACLYPDEIFENVLMKRLTLDGTLPNRSCNLFERRLSARCHLAAVKPCTAYILPEVIDMVTTASDYDCASACLSSLRKLVNLQTENKKDSGEFVMDCLHKKCQALPRLLNWWLTGVSTPSNSDIFNDEALTLEISALLSDISRNLESSDQSLLVANLVPQFLSPDANIRALDHLAPAPTTRTVLLLEAVVGSARVGVPIPRLCEMCNHLVSLAVHCSDFKSHLSACRLIANLVNKTDEGSALDTILSNAASMLDSALKSSNVKDAVQAADLLGWVTKGLVLRGFGVVESWIDKLLALLGDRRKEVAMAAAQAFHVIMEHSLPYLSSQNYCTVKLLYRQRFFQCSTKLLRTCQNTPVGERSSYLLALAHLLQGVPQRVLANNMTEVLPLLMESLALESTILLLAALGTLGALLDQDIHRDYLMADVQTIVPRLQRLTTYKPSMKVRMGALVCLSRIASFPTELLIPFQYEVNSQLLTCLDDPKRLVRREAVKARMCWILLDAAGSKGK